MKRYYSYAGLDICIQGPNEYMYEDDRGLASFRVDYLENPDIFQFEVVDELDEPKGDIIISEPSFKEYEFDSTHIRYIGSVANDWKNAYMSVSHYGKIHHVKILRSSLGDRIGTHVVYRVLDSERMLMDKDGIFMHASFIEYNGKAILFTAPSGTGKSTQADLWVKHRNAIIMNGDRCAIRFIDGNAYACGVPFAGSSNISKNVTLPLQAIVCLGQAPSTTIFKINGYKGFRKLWEGVGVNTWDKKHVEFVSSFVERLLSKVNVYQLECTPDKSAVLALERVLLDDKS